MKKYKTTSGSGHWDPPDPVPPDESGEWKMVGSAAVLREGMGVQFFWFWEKLV